MNSSKTTRNDFKILYQLSDIQIFSKNALYYVTCI